MSTSRVLRYTALVAFASLAAALPAGCGNSDEGASLASGGTAASAAGKAGAANQAGAGGSIATPNAAVCEQQAPVTNQPCSVPTGTVCPTARGNCACMGGAWKCYEVAAGGAGTAGDSGAHGGAAGASATGGAGRGG